MASPTKEALLNIFRWLRFVKIVLVAGDGRRHLKEVYADHILPDLRSIPGEDMASSNNSMVQSPSELPDPSKATTSLPLDLARQLTVADPFSVGALSVMVWDILNNLKSDYLLLFKHRITLPTVVYFISRLGALSCILVNAIFTTALITDCTRIEHTIAALYSVAVTTTTLLFFFRVRAVFDQNRCIVAFFALIWLAVLAGCIAATQGLSSSNISSTGYCKIDGIKDYTASAGIIPLVNDTLVFLAISFRLMANTHWEYTLKDGLRALVFGDYLSSFSRAFLQDGQAYYLTTVTMNVLTVTMLYLGTVPNVYRTMCIGPNIVIMNIMACRVFRNTKFGLLKQDDVSTNIKFKSRNDHLETGTHNQETAYVERSDG